MNNHSFVIYQYSCKGLEVTLELGKGFEKISNEIGYLPPNTGQSIQTFPEFITQNIKRAWTIH